MIKIPDLDKVLIDSYASVAVKAYKKFLNKYYKNDEKRFGLLFNLLKDATGKLDDAKIRKLILADTYYMRRLILFFEAFNFNGNYLEKMGNVYDSKAVQDFLSTWAEKIGVTTCPYCNRSYVFTVSDKSIRPQYDHYYPISKYPYLSVCLYNLIPSCAFCNWRKRDLDSFDLRQATLNPFFDEFGDDAIFTAEGKSVSFSNYVGIGTELEIKIEAADKIRGLSVAQENSIKTFALDGLYKKHNDYAKELKKLSVIYTDEYLMTLLTNYPWLGNYETLKNLIYLNYLDKKDWPKRILSKFTHDLSKQFDNTY